MLGDYKAKHYSVILLGFASAYLAKQVFFSFFLFFLFFSASRLRISPNRSFFSFFLFFFYFFFYILLGFASAYLAKQIVFITKS